MRRRRRTYAWEARSDDFLRENAAFKRFVLRELEREGPMLSRDLAYHAKTPRNPHPWWGQRQVALMLMILETRGKVAVTVAGTASGSGISPSVGIRRRRPCALREHVQKEGPGAGGPDDRQPGELAQGLVPAPLPLGVGGGRGHGRLAERRARADWANPLATSPL